MAGQAIRVQQLSLFTAVVMTETRQKAGWGTLGIADGASHKEGAAVRAGELGESCDGPVRWHCKKIKKK